MPNYIATNVIIRPELRTRKFQPPVTQEDINSILNDGQAVAGIVRPGDDKDHPILLDGEQRLRWIIEANKQRPRDQQIPFRADVWKGGDVEAVERGIKVNAHRKDTSLIDRAHNIQLLYAQGRTFDQIGAIWGKTGKWASDQLDLLKYDEETQRAIHDRLMTPKEADVLAEYPLEAHREIIEKAEEVRQEQAAAPPSVPPSRQSKKAAKAAKAAKPEPKKRGATTKKRTAEHIKEAARRLGVQRKEKAAAAKGKKAASPAKPKAAPHEVMSVSAFKRRCHEAVLEEKEGPLQDALKAIAGPLEGVNSFEVMVKRLRTLEMFVPEEKRQMILQEGKGKKK